MQDLCKAPQSDGGVVVPQACFATHAANPQHLTSALRQGGSAVVGMDPDAGLIAATAPNSTLDATGAADGR